ncbi:hypothetical protein [Parasegetibacter sp. NRK P23]|uniref:hypothetical protein n=1 Tax=Parasegetibacter sp. NRK P23 TaxID=2942999 RepID=UPI002043CCE7|nr:hypothetical protein [Parasegetibacter sp. NRK P23]MCM5529900.1 hypothetical protein [Parasegetibacter sp. NRK P23]
MLPAILIAIGVLYLSLSAFNLLFENEKNNFIKAVFIVLLFTLPAISAIVIYMLYYNRYKSQKSFIVP